MRSAVPPEIADVRHAVDSGAARCPSERYVESVEARLGELLSFERKRWERQYPALGLGFDALWDFVLGGGKRIRPRFAYWGYVGCGGDPSSERLVELGAAIEMLHAFALIHDDVMDGSDTRRHQPTVHRRYAAHHQELGWQGEPRRVSEGFAILLGDLAFVYSSQLLRAAPPRLVSLFDEMRIELHVGQYLDLMCAADGSDDESTVANIARFKTAKYSVERPLHLGAALARSQRFDSHFSRYGLAVGEAFQHRDDLLGVFGDSQETGKPSGDDIRAGKSTLLLQRARRAAMKEKLSSFERIGTPQLTERDITEICSFMVHCGAVEAVEKRIVELVDDTLESLRRAELGEAATAGLEQMARSAAWRTA